MLTTSPTNQQRSFVVCFVCCNVSLWQTLQCKLQQTVIRTGPVSICCWYSTLLIYTITSTVIHQLLFTLSFHVVSACRPMLYAGVFLCIANLHSCVIFSIVTVVACRPTCAVIIWTNGLSQKWMNEWMNEWITMCNWKCAIRNKVFLFFRPYVSFTLQHIYSIIQCASCWHRLMLLIIDIYTVVNIIQHSATGGQVSWTPCWKYDVIIINLTPSIDAYLLEEQSGQISSPSNLKVETTDL